MKILRGIRSYLCVGLFSLVLLPQVIIAQEYVARSPSDERKYFDIPPQSLETALIVCAEQAGLQIIFRAELLKGWQSSGIRGRYEPAVAIATLLNASGFRFEFSGARTVIVSAAPSSGASRSPQSQLRNHSQN